MAVGYCLNTTCLPKWQTLSKYQLTVRNPPNVCPKSMFGLYSAVAKMNPPNMDPIPVKIAMYFTFWHGMKNAANAITGLAIALNVTAK